VEPPSPNDRALPPGFHLRRPVAVDAPATPTTNRLDSQVVCILGEGPFAVALRLEALDRGATLEGSPDVVIDASAAVVDGFALARGLDTARPAVWICATRLGADPSWVDPEVGLVHGARAGFAKALGREWERTDARVVDTNPTLKDDEAARLVLDEVGIDDRQVEVFVDGDRRRAVALVLEDTPSADTPLPDGAVVVLTGGTRGITAQVALELARRGPVRLALLSRTPPGDVPLNEKAAKVDIKADLKAAGERATPAQVEARLRRLRSAEEARQTVAQLTALGAEVRFYRVDMADEGAVRDTLQRVRDELGHIDGVVHGAGVEISRLIADKGDEEFALVYDGKARGGMALAHNLERVAWFVSMGSVAGRFGNPGQVDYAAANEAMARVCLSRPRSLHVDWTAWADTGMAVRGGMAHLLSDRGVQMIPAPAGASLLVDLVTQGVTGEVVVAGRLGDLGLNARHPLLDRIDFDGPALIGEVVLRAGDPELEWLRDHSIDGTPVLPGVIGLELMAAVAAELVPDQPLVGAEEVSYDAPVKVHPGSPVTVRVRAERDGDDVVCTLSSERTARTGRALLADHFSARVRFGDPDLLPALPPAFFEEHPIDQAAIYRRFFHGPVFQVLEEAEAVFAQGVVATGRVDHGPIGRRLRTAPLILEAAFQAAGLHRMVVDGAMALPAGIDLLRLDTAPADRAELSVVVHRRGDRYDVDVDGPSGSVLRVRGLRLIDTGPLPDGDRFEAPEGGWPEAMLARAVADGAGGPSALLAEEAREIAARGTPRRQADRTAGRRAARAAVSALTGWTGAEFRVTSAQTGQPLVSAPALRPPRVSVTHTDGVGWAVATRRGHPGLDVEAVALRPPSFAATWFTPGEQAATAGDPWAETATWCVKEAVMKALGLGMALHPRDIDVTLRGSHGAAVRLTGQAHDAWQALGGGPLTVQVGALDGRVAAAALLAPGSAVAPRRARTA
jgi:NAD(P)-dependent dehydrogenase (short-subunit alcohol dehydrogenase family)/phosphopantetheinyl transferase